MRFEFCGPVKESMSWRADGKVLAWFSIPPNCGIESLGSRGRSHFFPILPV